MMRPQLLALVSALFLASPAAVAQQPPTDAKATALPSARTEGLSFSVDGDQLLLKDESSGKISRLHPIAAAVFALSDGKTSPAGIQGKLADLTGYTGTDELVFAALDALADAGLLKARVTPPGTAPLDLVVTPDGLLGSSLVTAATAESKKIDPKGISAEEAKKKNLASESAAKAGKQTARKQEEAAKAQNKEISERSTLRRKAVEAHLKLQESAQKNDEQSNKKLDPKAPMKEQKEKMQKEQEVKAQTARDKARQAATSEATLRRQERENKEMATEQAKKKK
jgi:hypothetical protein